MPGNFALPHKLPFAKIGMIGGPGAGKSTAAAWLFSALKETMLAAKQPFSVELVREVAKDYAFSRTPISGWDQWSIFVHQLMLEEKLTQAGVDLVVSDSPLLLNAFYGERTGAPLFQAMKELALKRELASPSLFINVGRHRPYVEKGRWEDEKTASSLDGLISDYVRNAGKSVFYWDGVRHGELLAMVLGVMGWHS